ncbi:MAG: hypothetical protein M3518_09150 [Actinomycetota bacterium]|nr:hypothetical protein [Actinomycetota bacterium]
MTIQNKGSPEKAHTLYDHLRGVFSPFLVEAEGLSLWRYVDGPWEPIGAYPFEKP